MQWVLPLALLASAAGILLPWQRMDHFFSGLASTSIAMLQTLPFLLLLALFLDNDTSYLLVALNGGADFPWHYRISAAWASREGPLLLWVALLGLLHKFYARRRENEPPILHLARQRLVHGFNLTLLLTAMMLEPFRTTENSFQSGMNVLLQTDLMVIHPPLIFLFYSLCMITGSFALPCILHGVDDVAALTRRMLSVARLALFVGVLGIGLGGLWAYTVLDWGGYWAWDPVETASFLPWLAILILCHMRLRSGKEDGRWIVVAGMAPLLLAINATMVTRANGVWASVHAFVASGEGELAQDAWGRLFDLRGVNAAGSEVTVYLVLLLTSVFLIVAWLLQTQLRGEWPRGRWPVIGWMSLALVPLVPGGWWLTEGIWTGEYSIGGPLEWISSPLLLLLCATPFLIFLKQPHLTIRQIVDTPQRAATLFAGALLTLYFGSAVVGLLTFLVILLLITHRDNELPIIWMVVGVLMMLFFAWSQLIGLAAAAVGILLFLSPWLLAKEEPEDENLESIGLSERIKNSRFQQRIVLWAPVTILSALLLLSWSLLLNSIDGTSLAAHELFSAPLFILGAAALTVYGWRRVIEPQKIPLFLSAILGLSILFGWVLELPLGGDMQGELSEHLTRGQVAWLVLPWLVVAAPGIARLALLALRSVKQAASAPVGAAAHRALVPRLRTSAAHLAHLGILLLLIGHIFSTTLIDRTDPSHQISLPQGEVVEHGDLRLRFVEVVTAVSGEEDFDSRFAVGDAYLGARIEILDDSGAVIETVEPGMLRFDNAFRSMPRSEVDRYVRWHGDVVFILDWQQTTLMGNRSLAGEVDQIERVRVTVYDLPASHLVWAGWALILLGTCINGSSWSGPRIKQLYATLKANKIIVAPPSQ